MEGDGRRSSRAVRWIVGSGILATLLVVIAVAAARGPEPDFERDGGLELVLRPVWQDTPPEACAALLKEIMEVQRARLDGFGATGAELEVASGLIVARLPGAVEAEAFDLALALRTSALPLPLVVARSRTVAPAE